MDYATSHLLREPETTIDWWKKSCTSWYMVNIPWFKGFHTSQVVQDFFHQQYTLLKLTVSLPLKIGPFWLPPKGNESSTPTIGNCRGKLAVRSVSFWEGNPNQKSLEPTKISGFFLTAHFKNPTIPFSKPCRLPFQAPATHRPDRRWYVAAPSADPPGGRWWWPMAVHQRNGVRRCQNPAGREEAQGLVSMPCRDVFFWDKVDWLKLIDVLKTSGKIGTLYKQ